MRIKAVSGDSPTSEGESHNLIAAFAAIHRCTIHRADVTSAYFQAQPLDQVVMMKPPRGGLPRVDSNQLMLVRVPIYGLCDSGRGFWKRLVAPQIFPAFYFYNISEESPETGVLKVKIVAVMTPHVDDLLYSYLPEGKQYMDQLLGKFDIGSQESETFWYCGKQFTTTTDGITVDVSDNTLKIKPIPIEQGRPNSDALQPHELSQLRSVVGSLCGLRVKHGQICCTLCLNCNPTFRKHVSQLPRTRAKQSILLLRA